MGGWVGWLEKWELKLTSAKIEVEVEVEAELGNIQMFFYLLNTEIHTQILNRNPFLCDIRRLKYLPNTMWF